MDFKLSILLLTIGILSIVVSVYCVAKELIKSKTRDTTLKATILTNVGANSNASSLNKETCFVVSEKEDGCGTNHYDIEFDSDLHALNERSYNQEFISVFEKEPAQNCQNSEETAFSKTLKGSKIYLEAQGFASNTKK